MSFAEELGTTGSQDGVVWFREAMCAAGMGKISAGRAETLTSSPAGVESEFLWLLINFDRLRNPQPQVAEFLSKSLPGDSQNTGGLVLIPAGMVEDAGQQEPVHFPVSIRIKVPSI